MKTRIISAMFLVPLLVFFYLGGYWLMGFCFAVGLMGVYEFYKGFHAKDIHPCYPIAIISTIGLYCINIFGDHFAHINKENAYMFWLFATVLISMLYLFAIEKRKMEDALATIAGIVYVVFFSFYITLVDQTGKTAILVWIVILSSFGTDIAAYFGGYCLGKHKLCPKISPKKTIEGSIAGILGSIFICWLFGMLFAKPLLIHCVILGAMGGVFTQFGDLTASIFKRHMGIKDYGNLIPGHGGVLDRIDSVLFAAPMVYYYIVFVFGYSGL